MHILLEMYHRLSQTFGPQYWWPGDSPFEVVVGAILTQNTNWSNVEKAIENLKRHKALSSKIMHEMPAGKLAELIRPAGYFNIKAARLKFFMDFLMNSYSGNTEKMKKEDMNSLREKLLQIKGIGPETADSILLYALEKPAFVIDAYTKRVLSKHGIMDYNKPYEEFQELFLSRLNRDVKMFNEYHALFVKVGKTYCRRRKPLCDECPLSDIRAERNG
jgi:endonuclease III related protein